jgi:hypothetical protein
MTNLLLSRRQALLGASAIAGSAAMPGLDIPAALGKAPLSTQQTPYFYRFNHGKMQITVVSDGPLPLGDPSGAFLGTTKEDIGKMLTDNFLNPTNAVLEQNAVVVNTGDKLVLIDTGMGSSTMFGPTTGKLLKSLAPRALIPRTSTLSSQPMPIAITCGASWPMTESPTSRMPRSTFRRLTSTSGPTRRSAQGSGLYAAVRRRGTQKPAAQPR